MPNVIDRSRAEALIREQVVSTIFQDAPKQSVVMQLGRKLPNMTSRQTRIPVLSMLPLAYWVNGDTGYKQTSRQAWENVYLTAGELAVIVPIPEAVLADAEFDILGEVTPRVNEAIRCLHHRYMLPCRNGCQADPAGQQMAAVHLRRPWRPAGPGRHVHQRAGLPGRRSPDRPGRGHCFRPGCDRRGSGYQTDRQRQLTGKLPAS